MSRKSVAVLDVRSSEVTVVVGERGVNHTFVFKASKTEPYDGYDESAFFDTEQLSDARQRQNIKSGFRQPMREVLLSQRLLC